MPAHSYIKHSEQKLSSYPSLPLSNRPSPPLSVHLFQPQVTTPTSLWLNMTLFAMLDHFHPRSRPVVCSILLLVSTLTLSLTPHSSEAVPLLLPAPSNIPPPPKANTYYLPWEPNYTLFVLCIAVVLNLIYIFAWLTNWGRSCPDELLRPSFLPGSQVPPLTAPRSTRA